MDEALTSKYVVLLLLIVVASFALNAINNDFPLHYHIDEKIKFHNIVKGDSNYKHPLFMLQASRFLNLFLKRSDPLEIAVLARTVSAVFGALITLFTFLFSKMLVGPRRALLVGCAVAVLPILVVHAHYVKEDIILCSFLMSSLFFFFRFSLNRSTSDAVFLGISTGLAYSSKYVGILLLPVFLLAPLVCAFPQKRAFYKKLMLAAGASTIIFLMVNFPIILNFLSFYKGVSFEAGHAIRGHHIVISPLEHYFSFHLLNSLAPGITWCLLAPALVYIVYLLARWRSSKWEEKCLLLFALFFYLVIEISPMKPFPDFMRYAIPIAPVMCYFAFQGVSLLGKAAVSLNSISISAIIFALLSTYPAYQTLNYVYYMNRDTRAELDKWLANKRETAITENYTTDPVDVTYLASLQKKGVSRGTKYLVASSFAYDRYLYGGELKGQRDNIYHRNRFYKKLLRYSSREFRPTYRSYAFSNPTINVIEIRTLLENDVFEGEEINLFFQDKVE
jgi:hypothetical protein